MTGNRKEMSIIDFYCIESFRLTFYVLQDIWIQMHIQGTVEFTNKYHFCRRILCKIYDIYSKEMIA